MQVRQIPSIRKINLTSIVDPSRIEQPRVLYTWKMLEKVCLALFQCLLVSLELYRVRRFITKMMSNCQV